jgi:hypothetical protein
LICLLFILATCSPGDSPVRSDQNDSREPIARLDGKPIYREDVAPAVAFQVYRRQLDIYSLLKRETEEIVDRHLLARAAERQGISEADLLRREIGDRVEPVTDQDIQAYIAEQPEGTTVGPRERPRVAYYLSETRRIERRLAYMEDLREKSSFEFLLEPPAEPRTRVDVEGAPARGAPLAPVTLVHFATFSSPLSARSAEYLRRLDREFEGRLRWVHRHFLNPHDEVGLLAAELAVRAQEKGRFWEIHDRFFELGGTLGEDDLRRIVEKAGFEPAILESVRTDPSYLARVKRDIDAGLKAGVKREPVVYVNGRYFSATFPYEKLRGLIVEELGLEEDVTDQAG